MKEYGRLKTTLTDFTCTTFNFNKFIELKQSDECPEGFMPIEKVLPKPEPKDGEILWFRYHVEDDTLIKEYFCRIPPRNISKLNLYIALQPLGLYDKLVEYMKNSTTPDGINAWEAYNLVSDVISEEHPFFLKMLDDAASALGVEKNTIEDIFEKCLA